MGSAFVVARVRTRTRATTACTRSRRPSLDRTRATCVLTVASPTTQLGGDLGVGEPAREQPQHLALAGGQLGERGRRRGGSARGRRDESLDQPPRDGRARAARRRRRPRGPRRQLVGGRVLEQEPAGARRAVRRRRTRRGRRSSASAPAGASPAAARTRGSPRCRPAAACGRPSARRPVAVVGPRRRPARRRPPRRPPRCRALPSRIMRNPVRTSAWSSASSTRMSRAGAHRPAGRRRAGRVAAGVARARVRAGRRRARRARASRPVRVRPVRRRVRARAVVADLELDRAGARSARAPRRARGPACLSVLVSASCTIR